MGNPALACSSGMVCAALILVTGTFTGEETSLLKRALRSLWEERVSMAMCVPEGEFHCFYAASDRERRLKREGLRQFLRYFSGARALVDIGCGDGVLLELLRESYPQKKLAGVELNGEFLRLCADTLPGVEVIASDAAEFVSARGGEFDMFIMSDFIEHLEFPQVVDILSRIPPGASVFLKTPNVNSLLGHQFYLQMPGHKTPFSPFVMDKMLQRLGFRVVAQAECDGIMYPRSILGKLRRGLLRLLFVAEFSRFFGGGNYFVVAKKES
jgi:hypothetical protein